MLQQYAAEIKTAAALGVEIAIVIGGGNIFRVCGEPAVVLTGHRVTTWACWPL